MIQRVPEMVIHLAYRFLVDHEQRLIYKQVWDVYDESQLVASRAAFQKLPESLRYDELHDLTGVRSYAISYVGIEKLADDVNELYLRDNYPSKKVAYVAPLDAAYGTARAYQVLQHETNEEFRVFRKLDEGCAWLGVDISGFGA